MKVKSIHRKMVLNKISIANLTRAQLAQQKGGATALCPVTYTCVTYSELGDVCETMGLLVCDQDPTLP